MKKLIYVSILMLCNLMLFGQDLTKNVIASGGNTTYGVGEKIALTVGQNFIGLTEKTNEIAGVGFWYGAADFVTSVDFVSEPVEHSELILLQNYPNPFNAYTIIEFSISNDSKVGLNIMDLNGRLIERVIDEHMMPGVYKVSYNAEKLTGGIYIYELRVDDQQISKRMIHTR